MTFHHKRLSKIPSVISTICFIILLVLFSFVTFYGTRTRFPIRLEADAWHFIVCGFCIVTILMSFFALVKSNGLIKSARWMSYILLSIFVLYYTINFFGIKMRSSKILEYSSAWPGIMVISAWALLFINKKQVDIIRNAIIFCAMVSSMLAVVEWMLFYTDMKTMVKDLPWIYKTYNVFSNGTFNRDVLRPSAAIGNPNYLSFLCCCGFFLHIQSSYVENKSIRFSTLRKDLTSTIFNWQTCGGVLLITGIILSLSRAGFICLIVGLLMLIIKFRTSISLYVLLLCAVALILIIPTSIGRVKNIANTEDQPNINRMYYASFIFSNIKYDILGGKSHKELENIYHDKRNVTKPKLRKNLSRYLTIPGLWLNIFAGGGLAGILAFFLALFALPLWNTWDGWSNAFHFHLISLVSIAIFLLFHALFAPPIVSVILPFFSFYAGSSHRSDLSLNQ